jgi:hypothetical protein
MKVKRKCPRGIPRPRWEEEEEEEEESADVK